MTVVQGVVGPPPGGEMCQETVNLYVGKRLRRRRRLLGMTQQELAKAAGLQFQQIQKYECAANRIAASRLYSLAKALDVPVQYFFSGLGEDAPGAVAANDSGLDEAVRRRSKALLDSCCKLSDQLSVKLGELASCAAGEPS